MHIYVNTHIYIHEKTKRNENVSITTDDDAYTPLSPPG